MREIDGPAPSKRIKLDDEEDEPTENSENSKKTQ